MRWEESWQPLPRERESPGAPGTSDPVHGTTVSSVPTAGFLITLEQKASSEGGLGSRLGLSPRPRPQQEPPQPSFHQETKQLRQGATCFPDPSRPHCASPHPSQRLLESPDNKIVTCLVKPNRGSEGDTHPALRWSLVAVLEGPWCAGPELGTGKHTHMYTQRLLEAAWRQPGLAWERVIVHSADNCATKQVPGKPGRSGTGAPSQLLLLPLGGHTVQSPTLWGFYPHAERWRWGLQRALAHPKLAPEDLAQQGPSSSPRGQAGQEGGGLFDQP